MLPCRAWPGAARRAWPGCGRTRRGCTRCGHRRCRPSRCVPAEAVLQAADAALAAGAPLDQPTEATPALDQPAGGTGAASARDGHPSHAKVGQLLVDGRLAVAPVGGHRPWRLPGMGDHPPNGGGHQRRIRRVADHDLMIEHDPVGVVEDLGLGAELDRPAQPALADRPGVGVVQADQPAGPSGIPPASRARACPSSRSVRAMVASSSATTARSRPEGCVRHGPGLGGHWSGSGGRRPAAPGPAQRPAR
jgi:hypothetical protein